MTVDITTVKVGAKVIVATDGGYSHFRPGSVATVIAVGPLYADLVNPDAIAKARKLGYTEDDPDWVTEAGWPFAGDEIEEIVK